MPVRGSFSTRLVRVSVLGAALFFAACSTPQRAATPAAPLPPAPAPSADAGARLYVANQGAARVTVVDMATHEVVRTVDLQALGFSAEARPHHVAVEPDGSHYYVSLIGESKVLKFDRADHLVGQVDFETPGMLAVDPTSDRLFVGRSMMAVSPPQRIGIVRRADMTLDELDVFFPRPHALVVAPRTGYVYTASLAENRMASVDVDEEDVALLGLDGPPHTLVQFALSPDGTTLVATGQLTNQVLFFDVTTPAAPRLTGFVEVGAQPWHPVFTPDGLFLFVPSKEADAVSVIDVRRRAVETVITGPGLAQPHGSAVSPDGRYVYVSSNNLKGTYASRDAGGEARVGTVVVIDTATREIVKVIEVAPYAAGIGAPTRP